MTRDDAISLAREAAPGYDWSDESMANFATGFAALVAAAEREACAQVCLDYAVSAFCDGDPEADHEGAAYHVADLIRARGATPPVTADTPGNAG